MSDTPPKGTVVLIDDDAFLLGMYQTKFAKEGYLVEAFLSVQDALVRLRSGEIQPDAIVFDLIMPQNDGFALLEHVRDEHLAPGAVKIALTNQNSDAEKARIQSLGADAFLIKATLIPSEVVNTVADILGRNRNA